MRFGHRLGHDGTMLEAVWWLLTPSTLLVLLVLLAFAAGRLRAGRLAGALLFFPLLLLLALVLAPVDEYLGNGLESRIGAPDPLPERVDGIIVLGGAVEWRVSAARSQLALDDAGERLLAALALAKRYPEAELVFTGLFMDALREEWKGADGEGLLFQDTLRGRRVTFLGEARSTYEEALLARERVAPAAGSTWLLVTSALHMPRAYGTFKAQGWQLTPFSVDYRSLPPSEWRAAWRFDLAVGKRLAGLDRVVREWGAYQVYKRAGRLVD